MAENKSLKTITSLQVGGTARYFGLILTSEDVLELLQISESKNLPLIVLGGGCNSIVPDGIIDAVIGKMSITGTRIHKDFGESVQVEFGAGVDWDDAVAWSVSEGLSGIEALSGIPGSVGAAPIQNIGAYGADLSDTFVSCRAISIEDKKEIHIPIRECGFEYRNSNFKKYPGKFVVTHVTLELSRKSPKLPEYKDVQEYFKKAKRKPTLKQIRNAILEIRERKLPDPKTIPNAGSFFVNPIIDREFAQELFNKYPQMPYFELDNGDVKLLAGWLIDKVGLKGHSFGNVGIYDKNALVITTNGKASYDDIIEATKYIQNKVKQQFDVDLDVEPRTLV